MANPVSNLNINYIFGIQPNRTYTSVIQFLQDKQLSVPDNKTPIFFKKFAIGPAMNVTVYSWGDYIFVDNDVISWNFWHVLRNNDNKEKLPLENDDITCQVIGQAYSKTIEVEEYNRNYNYGWNKNQPQYLKVHQDDRYEFERKQKSNLNKYATYHDWEWVYKSYLYLKILITCGRNSQQVELKWNEPTIGGTADLGPDNNSIISIKSNCFGRECFRELDISHWYKFSNLLNCNIIQGKLAAWDRYLDLQLTTPIENKGVKAAESKKEIKITLERLKAEAPTIYKFYQWLHEGKTVNKISNNSLLSALLLAEGHDFDKLKRSLENAMDNVLEISKNTQSITRSICLSFDAAKEKDNKRREHEEWYLRKTNGEKAEGLGVDLVKHVKLHTAISEGKIPLSLFHNSKNQMQLINVEFDLWEKALNRKGWEEIIYNIASSAARRNTYDKHVIPYLSFLFKIEKYLDRHAPGDKQWKAMPKYVSSQWELEMEEANENQTQKRRSALTPIIDNDTRTIEVPYAAIAIHGRQTTYCYSSHYYVFEENMVDPESQSIIIKDLEEKLNGRDDYGLMHYTLDGTPRNQGYPTFLIIFERRKKETFVHFHRVHPCRSKNGISVPACRLIEECYRYMCSAKKEEIYQQQGDLIFVKNSTQLLNIEDSKSILSFENHEFSTKIPVKFWDNKAKSSKYRLGFIFSKDGFCLKHPEHEWVNFEPGYYEVLRVRSWEANPIAVWSYTID